MEVYSGTDMSFESRKSFYGLKEDIRKCIDNFEICNISFIRENVGAY